MHHLIRPILLLYHMMQPSLLSLDPLCIVCIVFCQCVDEDNPIQYTIPIQGQLVVSYDATIPFVFRSIVVCIVFCQCDDEDNPIQYTIPIRGQLASGGLQLFVNVYGCNPIKYPIPIHLCTIHYLNGHFVNEPSDMTQSNTQFQLMGSLPVVAISFFGNVYG